jgi:uncharacterized protein (DUF433 family)
MPSKRPIKFGVLKNQVQVSEEFDAPMSLVDVPGQPPGVTRDSSVMGGAPCFAGTRVPVGTVLGSLDEGYSLEELRNHYPFLTPAHVEAARAFASEHPHTVTQAPKWIRKA